MMSDVDFTEMVRETLSLHWTTEPDVSQVARRVLDTRVPNLCPDCRGTQLATLVVFAAGPDVTAPCKHLAAPTLGDLLSATGDLAVALEETLSERDALQAKVDAINALHQCSQQTYPDEPQWCDDCGYGWPCSTHLALHPEGDTPT